MIYCEDIIVNSRNSCELIDITEDVQRILDKSGLSCGIINIQSMHTTSGIIVNENEAGLKEDYLRFISEIVPELDYKHDLIDNNARSHLMGMISNPSLCLNFKDKRLSLGTWQNIFFAEYDGPRTNRRINVQIIGK